MKETERMNKKKRERQSIGKESENINGFFFLFAFVRMRIYCIIKISDKKNIYILYIHIYRDVCSALVSHLFEQSVLIFAQMNVCVHMSTRALYAKLHACGV